MIIEQRPELSRLIDRRVIAPWKSRWLLIRMLLLFGMVGFLFFGEVGLFGGWLVNDFSLAPKITGIGLLIMLAPFLLLGIVFQILGAVCYLVKRPVKSPGKWEITFGDGEIVFGSDGRSIEWKDVFKFQFEPIAEVSGMTKFSLSRLSSRRKREAVLYEMVIENSGQVGELVSFLHQRKVEGPYPYKVTVLDHPARLFQTQTSFLSDLAGAAGMVVFMNGLIILLQIFDQFELSRFAKWRRFIAHHFSSPAEFHLYCFVLGAVLTVAGFLLMRWYKREEKRVQALAD